MEIEIDSKIKKFTKKYYKVPKFIPGETYLPATTKLFTNEEFAYGVQSILDGWWTEGRFTQEFERQFALVTGCRYVTLVNSGSSANLIALTCLTSTVFGKRALSPGDEVITVACGFPTTVNPILQNRCVPVFVDVSAKTKNVLPEEIEKAVTKKTKAIMIAHTLGNPMPLDEILPIVKKYNLWFIEDCCDALGATYNGKPVGTFGDIATYSFYPAHQITMGEGGGVVTNNPLIYRSIRQFRDWGRDCWCDTGQDDTCGRRFQWKMGELPYGYDHKFIYSQIGYNLKLTDMQAAIGLAQLKKLPEFIQKRRDNFNYHKKELKKYDKYLRFSENDKKANPCWFGFMIVVDEHAPFSKLELVSYLEDHKVGTRQLFAGNLLKHPAYLKREDIRVIGNLENTDMIMNQGFWIGVHPKIGAPERTYIYSVFASFFRNIKNKKSIHE